MVHPLVKPTTKSAEAPPLERDPNVGALGRCRCLRQPFRPSKELRRQGVQVSDDAGQALETHDRTHRFSAHRFAPASTTRAFASQAGSFSATAGDPGGITSCLSPLRENRAKAVEGKNELNRWSGRQGRLGMLIGQTYAAPSSRCNTERMFRHPLPLATSNLRGVHSRKQPRAGKRSSKTQNRQGELTRSEGGKACSYPNLKPAKERAGSKTPGTSKPTKKPTNPPNTESTYFHNTDGRPKEGGKLRYGGGWSFR